MKMILLFWIMLCSMLPLGAYPTHPPQLTKPIKRLYQLEETKQLLANVEKEGPITIRSSFFGFEASNAAWMASQRTIFLNFSKPRSEGTLIASIVFELHNALLHKQFDYFDSLAMTGQISREHYIEAIERIEYTNAQKAAHILHKGICRGVFPADASWNLAPTFAEHYQIQIQAGHSGMIGTVYDSLASLFQGRNPNRMEFCPLLKIK
jgi:hypothetical protein